MKKLSCLALLSALLLSGCVTRDDADQKIAKGCAAAADLFLTDSFKVKTIKQSTFADSAELGKGYRAVDLQVVENDGWADVDKEVKCVFTESYGFLGASYNAQIYTLKMDDKVYGYDQGQIVGTYEENLKLTEGVDKAMMQ